MALPAGWGVVTGEREMICAGHYDSDLQSAAADDEEEEDEDEDEDGGGAVAVAVAAGDGPAGGRGSGGGLVRKYTGVSTRTPGWDRSALLLKSSMHWLLINLQHQCSLDDRQSRWSKHSELSKSLWHFGIGLYCRATEGVPEASGLWRFSTRAFT